MRRSIQQRLRFDVLRRCNYACYYCGRRASLGVTELQLDHVIPVSHGGTNDPWNLVAACAECNAGKSASAPTEELVQRVRSDYCAYLSISDAIVVQCEHCGVPMEHEPAGDDDAPPTRCERCDEVVCDTYEMGWRSGAAQARGPA